MKVRPAGLDRNIRSATGDVSLLSEMFGRNVDGQFVLVTGGAGFIGHQIALRLHALGGCVCVVDDLSTGVRARLPQASDRFRFIEGSVLDRSVLAQLPDNLALVIHLASVVGMRRVHADPAYALRVSDEGTRDVLSATAGAPAVLMSSSAVYGRTPLEVSRETDTVSWDGALDYDGGTPGYACGKLALERHGAQARQSGRRQMTLRPFNVVGPGQLGSYGMVLPQFATAALANQPLRVFDDGLQVRSFIHAPTFVDCLIQLAASDRAWASDQPAINVGAPRATTILDLARTVIAEAGSQSRIEFEPFEASYPGKKDVRHRFPSTEHMESLLGPVAWPTVPEIVRDVLRSLGPVSLVPGDSRAMRTSLPLKLTE